MNLIAFLNSPDWDSPFFKKLAHNDTGAAQGHQGGMVIPQELRAFFPRLAGQTSAENPTVDTEVEAYLYNHENELGKVIIRYQIQTWGGTRPPETRLTGSLGPIRNISEGEDIVIFQRHKDSLHLYRLILIRQNTSEYVFLEEIIENRRWGFLFEQPMIEEDLDTAEEEQNSREASDFTLFETEENFRISRSRIIARSYAFRKKVIEIYNNTCCVCETHLETPSGMLELDAAHIVPRSKSGVDEARNGLALCKRHHWAFDRGLFGINEARSIIIPRSVLVIESNNSLAALNNTYIREAIADELRAEDVALTWHRENILIQD